MEEEKPYRIWLLEYFFKLVHIIIGYCDVRKDEVVNYTDVDQ